MKNKPVGVFDSGVGGLTVVRSMIDRMPSEDIIYLGDQARGPYGPRNLDEVRSFAADIVDFLIGFPVKLVVVACNTATAAALGSLQRDYDTPMVGVIAPGARAAVERSTNRHIGVIGTSGTVRSGSYQMELKRLDPTIEVSTQACPEFVEFVERNEVHGNRIFEIAKGYLEPMIDAGVDVVILGCTHYPLLEDLIEEVVGPGVSLISSADETAVEVEDVLGRLGWLSEPGRDGNFHFLTTGDVKKSTDLGKMFLGPEVREVKPVTLDSRPQLEIR